MTDKEEMMDVYLREADMDDAEDVLKWRNDEVTRANSFNREKISLMSHLKWFEKKLGQEGCYMFILMDGQKKVGHIRVDVTDDFGEISYMIAPDARGRGYGTKAIGLVEKEMPREVKSLMGLTLKTNAASGRCFEKNGYTSSDAGDALCYSKSIDR